LDDAMVLRSIPASAQGAVALLLSERQVGDHGGAALIHIEAARTKVLVGNKGYASNRFR
jgi:hypothetical protein